MTNISKRVLTAASLLLLAGTSASCGERNTGDFRAELSGTKGPLGYYLYAGNLTTNGFNPNSDFYANSVYWKLRLDITDRLKSTVTFGYNAGDRGLGEVPEQDISSRNDFEYLFSSLSLNYRYPIMGISQEKCQTSNTS